VLTEALGYRPRFLQTNVSTSCRNVVRGVHGAMTPPGLAKFVTCLRGSLLDFVVDVRTGSPTFGQWDAVLLDDQDRKALYLAEGLGHAFIALADGTVVNYLCSAPYAPGREHGVHPMDAAIGIEWPTEARDGTPLVHSLSPKDDQAPALADLVDSGLLPTYAEAQEYVDSLRIDL